MRFEQVRHTFIVKRRSNIITTVLFFVSNDRYVSAVVLFIPWWSNLIHVSLIVFRTQVFLYLTEQRF